MDSRVSTRCSRRYTRGGGWPPQEMSKERPSLVRSTRATTAVQNLATFCRRICRLTTSSTELGFTSRTMAARTVYRTRPVTAAASGPFPLTSPRATAQLFSPASNTS